MIYKRAVLSLLLFLIMVDCNMDVSAQEYQTGDLESRHIVDIVILGKDALNQRHTIPDTKTDPLFSQRCAEVVSGLSAFCASVNSTRDSYPKLGEPRLIECVDRIICDTIDVVKGDLASLRVGAGFLDHLFSLISSMKRSDSGYSHSRWIRIYADRISPKFVKTVEYLTNHDFNDQVRDYQLWDEAEADDVGADADEYEQLYSYVMSPRIASERALLIMIEELKETKDSVNSTQHDMADYMMKVLDDAVRNKMVVLVRILHDT